MAARHSAITTTDDRARTAAPAILAILLGVFLIYGIGFAHPQILHTVAHDSRHSFAFPCH